MFCTSALGVGVLGMKPFYCALVLVEGCSFNWICAALSVNRLVLIEKLLASVMQRFLQTCAQREDVTVERAEAVTPPSGTGDEQVGIDKRQMWLIAEFANHIVDHDLMPFARNAVVREDAEQAVRYVDTGHLAQPMK